MRISDFARWSLDDAQMWENVQLLFRKDRVTQHGMAGEGRERGRGRGGGETLSNVRPVQRDLEITLWRGTHLRDSISSGRDTYMSIMSRQSRLITIILASREGTDAFNATRLFVHDKFTIIAPRARTRARALIRTTLVNWSNRDNYYMAKSRAMANKWAIAPSRRDVVRQCTFSRCFFRTFVFGGGRLNIVRQKEGDANSLQSVTILKKGKKNEIKKKRIKKISAVVSRSVGEWAFPRSLSVVKSI